MQCNENIKSICQWLIWHAMNISEKTILHSFFQDTIEKLRLWFQCEFLTKQLSFLYSTSNRLLLLRKHVRYLLHVILSDIFIRTKIIFRLDKSCIRIISIWNLYKLPNITVNIELWSTNIFQVQWGLTWFITGCSSITCSVNLKHKSIFSS